MRNLLALLLLAPCALLAQIPDYVPSDGLAGWWSLDGIALDASTNALHGTLEGPYPTEDRHGNPNGALSFDGVDDRVSIPHSEFTNPSVLSLSVWFKDSDFSNSDGQQSQLISKREFTGWGNAYEVGIGYPINGIPDTPTIYSNFSVNGNHTVYHATDSLLENQWHHVVYCHGADSLFIYLDGEPVLAQTSPGPLPTNNALPTWFGGRPGGSGRNFFSGLLDDVGLWNRVLTAEEVAALFLAENSPALPDYVPNDGLVAWYPFNGNTENLAGDNGTLATTATDWTMNRDGLDSSAIAFTALNSHALGSLPADFQSNQYSYALWWRIDGAYSYNGYNLLTYPNASPGNVSNNALAYTIDENWYYLNCPNASSGYTSSARIGFDYTLRALDCATLEDLEQWNHSVVTVDGNMMRLYFNGTYIDSVEVELDMSSFPGETLILGAHNNPAQSSLTTRILDEVGIWNRVLNPSEIQALYSAETSVIASNLTSAGLFDGDDHIWLTDADFLNFGQSSFTAHVQFRPTDLSDLVECCGYQTLIAKGAAGGTGEKGFNLDLRGEPGDARIKCNLSTGPGINVILNAPIEEGQWYDLVFIADWDTEWASLFVNGTLVDEGSMAGLGDMNNSWNPSIGRFVWNNSNSYNGAFFKGEMSWLRILNEADYELGQSPCALREFTVLELTDFTAEEVADQVSSSFNIDEVIDVNAPCGGFAATYGCTDPTACNYNPTATEDDGSCNFQIPVFLGNDTALCGTELVLDAGSGYADYQWSTGDTTRTIVVDVSGEYGVSVSGGLNRSLTITSSQETHPFSAPPIDGAWTEGTISTWVNFQSRDLSLDADGTHIFSGYTGPTDIVMLGFHTSALDGNNGELLFGFYESGPGWRFATSSLIPELDVWYYITASWGGNGLTIYVDGELSGHHPYSGPIPVPDQYTLGGNLNASAPCKMANLSIWDQQLELEEISALSNCSSFAEDNLVGVWNFEGQLSNAYLDLISGISSIVPSSVTAVIIDPGISDCTAELSPTNDLSSINQCPATDTLIVEFLIAGCTDSTACNFDIDLSCDDGSCEYGCLFCGDGTTWNDSLQMCIGDCPVEETPSLPNCGEGTVWDPVAEECIVAIPADINFDGCVTVGDLLELLAVHGTCPPYPEWPDFPGNTSSTGWSCGDPLPYQGYDYATVQIGDQCWFAENCRFLPSVSTPSNMGTLELDTVPRALVYGYFSTSISEASTTAAYANYGAMYNWAATENWEICPAGWHIPEEAEWQSLESNMGMSTSEVNDIGWQRGHEDALSIELQTNGFQINSTGGFVHHTLGFLDENNQTIYWSSTLDVSNLSIPGPIFHRRFSPNYAGVYRGSDFNQNSGAYVRCLKD